MKTLALTRSCWFRRRQGRWGRLSLCREAALTLVAALVVAVALTAASAAAYGPVTLHYYGKLGPHRVQMEITIDEEKVTGTYWHDSVGRKLLLEGTFKARTVDMAEINESGEVTGRWRGGLNPIAGWWEGTWTSADGQQTLEFDLQLVAEIVRTSEKRLGCVDVEVIRPVLMPALLTGKVDPAQRWIDSVAFLPVDAIVIERLAQPAFEPEMPWSNYYLSVEYRIAHFSPRLLSVEGTIYSYTGGAHGSYVAVPYTIVPGPSGPVEVQLEDVFLPGSGWEEKLADYVIGDLREQGAAWVVTGEVTEVAVESLHRFTLSPAGIRFYFDPYEMGPWVEGMYTVDVPWTELAGMVNLDGPAGTVVPQASGE